MIPVLVVFGCLYLAWIELKQERHQHREQIANLERKLEKLK